MYSVLFPGTLVGISLQPVLEAKLDVSSVSSRWVDSQDAFPENTRETRPLLEFLWAPGSPL